LLFAMGFLAFGDTVNLRQGLGFVIAIGAIFAYTHYTTASNNAAAAAKNSASVPVTITSNDDKEVAEKVSLTELASRMEDRE
jgi:hypothetical protein